MRNHEILAQRKERLSAIQKIEEVFRPMAGVVNGVMWGGTLALSAVGAMHRVFEHAEFAARYLGAGQAVAGYALGVTAGSLAGYAGLKAAEAFQRRRIEDKRIEIDMTERLKPKTMSRPVEQTLDKPQTLTAERPVVKEQKQERYKAFSKVLKPKQRQLGDHEHARA